jgi:hypothetical protein
MQKMFFFHDIFSLESRSYRFDRLIFSNLAAFAFLPLDSCIAFSIAAFSVRSRISLIGPISP